MNHIVYVDLSAKVEQWTRASAVAMSNSTNRALLLPAKEKQRVRRMLIARHGRRSVQYRVLAALVYLVVREDLPHIQQIVIDQDYSGHQVESTIKSLLIDLVRRDRPRVRSKFVRFEKVATSRADVLAKQVYDGQVKPDRVLRFAEIEALLKNS